MFHLRIESVRTTSALRSAANANELADAGYTVEDGYVVVETQAEADELLSEYSNLELDLSQGAERSGELERATVTEEGVEYEGEDEVEADEPTCAGTTADGDPCTRTVDEPGDYCYQHG